MKKALTIVWMFVLIGSLAQSALAQQTPLSSRARKLRESWEQLQRNPTLQSVQKQYLESFPQSYKSFLELFDLNRELYDGHDYIEVLPSLATNYEREVGELLLQLSQDAHYDADAPSYLQHATATYASQHTQMFGMLLKKLPTRKQDELIAFIADVEMSESIPPPTATLGRSSAAIADVFTERATSAV